MKQPKEPVCEPEREPDALRVRLGENGRLLLPTAVRQKMGAKAGDWMLLELVECEPGREELRVITAKQQLRQTIAQVRPLIPEGTNAAHELMRERQQETARQPIEAAWWR
jgi:bifunctional DNA-binding transcriptional regulator/antitoxin component of YhaV-PrlF toxin-antitoxin module